MFIHKYVSDFYFTQIMFNYDIQFLSSLNEEKFLKIYNLFKEYNFYFIEDIILNYLEIFLFEYDDVLKGINLLKEKLGDNFVSIIGKNMTHLDLLLEINEDKED